MEAGRYYMNTDPYLQFQAVLEKEPANRDALNYVINIAYSRGMLAEALQWVNTALKHYPNDRELLAKKGRHTGRHEELRPGIEPG